MSTLLRVCLCLVDLLVPRTTVVGTAQDQDKGFLGPCGGDSTHLSEDEDTAVGLCLLDLGGSVIDLGPASTSGIQRWQV